MSEYRMKLEYIRSQARRHLPSWPRVLPAPTTPLRALAPQPAPPLPGTGNLPLSRVLHLEDFEAIAPWIRMAAPGRRPGRLYRKDWEVAMALRALSATGVLNGDSEVLGIAAGNESTVYVLTNYVRRVFATDLYLAAGWEESATASLMTHPGQHWSGPWRPGRLVVQNMNALDLWYEDGNIDAIFSSGSIEHFGDYHAVETSIREMFRVLKPGGICTLSTEFRLDGIGAGLPGTLMFSADELRRHVLEAAPWELIDEIDLTAPSIESLAPVLFSKAAVEVRQHERKYGPMDFDQLEFSQWPHVALTHRGMTWTSCHLVLRKPS